MKITQLAVVLALFVAAATFAAGTAEAAKKKHPRVAKTVRPAVTHQVIGTPADPYAVYASGTYIGRDPDPAVRRQMLMDFYGGLGNR